MTLPPIVPEQAPSGISLDPQTLERVIPESKRSDGSLFTKEMYNKIQTTTKSVRKQLKIRPGFTPQEDVRRFRGTRQAQMDANALPKGHIIGWAPPSSSTQPAKPMTKSAKKNAKRKEKRETQRKQAVAENWEEDEEDEAAGPEGNSEGKADSEDLAEPPVKTLEQTKKEETPVPKAATTNVSQTPSSSSSGAATPRRKPAAVGGSALLAKELAKLDLQNKRQ